MTNRKELFDVLIEEADHAFAGWNFSYISSTGRVQSEPLPWNYVSLLYPYIRGAKSLLDMGTGGGELLSLLQPFPKHTCATEAYTPNVPIAKRKLSPLGVDVFEIKDDKDLPFRESEFEVIINRHESYAPEEVQRILQPSGVFITQQVGEENDIDINRLLDCKLLKEEKTWNAASASKELQDHGFNVVVQMEAFPLSRFYDVGALVFHLKAIPWIVHDFSVDTYIDALRHIHDTILKRGFIEVHEHRFLIITENSNT